MAGFRIAGPVGLYQEPLPVLEDGRPGDEAVFGGGEAEDPALALGGPDGVTLTFGGERYRLRSTESPWGPSGEEHALTKDERAQFFVQAALQDLDPALKRALNLSADVGQSVDGRVKIWRLRPPVPWRPPETPLPLPPPAGSSSKAAPKPKKESWVEVAVVTDTGKPHAGATYKIELPDGSVRTGKVGADGVLAVNGIDPGSCKFTFTDLDGSSWSDG